jgi:hypothetical protein
MKITDGAYSFASKNNALISFSPSPIHLDTKVDAETLKKVLLHSVAIALANIVFPVPGGPYKRMPLVGERRPLKISGRRAG